VRDGPSVPCSSTAGLRDASPRLRLELGAPLLPVARLLEIISPAGFERFFEEMVDLGGVVEAAPETLADLCARYELEMQPDSVPGLVERFGLRFAGEPI
jgi:hypothetical protein